MIPRLIFFSLLILSLKSEKLESKDINLQSTVDPKKVYSTNELASDTLNFMKTKDYNIFDPNKYISSSFQNDIISHMKDIYNSKRIRVYFFYVHDVTDHSYKFLSDTMKLIGQKTGDPNADYFISILFNMNQNKYLYRIGGGIGTNNQKRDLSTKLGNYLSSFGTSRNNNNLEKFSVELINLIKETLIYNSPYSPEPGSNSRKIYSRNQLVIDTYQEMNSRYYHLFDPDGHIKKSKSDFDELKMNMNKLFKKKKIKTFIFIIYGLDYPNNFLVDIMRELSRKISEDMYPNNYLSILITTYRKQYYYYLGSNIDSKLIIERKIRQQLDYLLKYGISKTLNKLIYDIYTLED